MIDPLKNRRCKRRFNKSYE